MIDAEILSAVIHSRQAFDRIKDHVVSKDLSPGVGFWFEIVGAWYARDKTAQAVDINALRALGESRITNPKQRETILTALSSLPSPISPENTATVALELRRHNVGLELAAAIAAQDSKKVSKLHEQFGDLLKATTLEGKKHVDDWEDAVDIERIFDKVGQEQRVALAPNSLNQRINGGALPGHHIIAFARPEMGKSTFAVNMGVQLAIRGKRVLYIGNEDQINILKARALSRATLLNTEQLEANREKAIAIYREKGIEDRLHFVRYSGTPLGIRGRIDDYEPDILILDQIRNLESDEEGIVQRLETNGQAVRRLLLEYGLIGLSITQAGASADGKVMLDMHDIDNSKTGLPGTADLIVGIGGNADMVARNQRFLSLPKNKLSSEGNAHEGIVVDIDKARSLYK